MTVAVDTTNVNFKYETREDWLNAFVRVARPVFIAANAPLPYNLRVSVGFTSKGFKGNRIGECWSDDASEDGNYEIFIKPTVDGVVKICDILTHELIHAAVGIQNGHGAAFKRVAVALGLKGKMTATYAGEDWYRWAVPLINDLGPIPYAPIDDGGISTARSKQKAYLLKLECNACGWTARATYKHVQNKTLRCPDVKCSGNLVCEGL